MVTYTDLSGMSSFTKSEIDAVAQHKHISDMAAVLLAEDLSHRNGGVLMIQRMIMDHIARAQEAGDSHEAERWRRVLQQFIKAVLTRSWSGSGVPLASSR